MEGQKQLEFKEPEPIQNKDEELMLMQAQLERRIFDGQKEHLKDELGD